jgi:hypothetical protein
MDLHALAYGASSEMNQLRVLRTSEFHPDQAPENRWLASFGLMSVSTSHILERVSYLRRLACRQTQSGARIIG